MPRAFSADQPRQEPFRAAGTDAGARMPEAAERLNVPQVVRKRLFIGLLVSTAVLVCLALFLIWIFPILDGGHPLLSWAYGTLLAIVLGLTGWTALGLVVNIAFGRSLIASSRIRAMTIRFFMPLMEMLGTAVGIGRDKVRASFVRVNNELVRGEARRYAPHEMLILLPHCLQRAACRHRLNELENCRRCGACPIDGLLALSARYGVRLEVATGGTLARRIIVERRPRFIIAVACERDLASGIQDAYPLPVYGVLNERPNGPCRDTIVRPENVEDALKLFLAEPGPRQ